MAEFGWEMGEDLIITRRQLRCGGNGRQLTGEKGKNTGQMSLVEGEDGMFDHLLRSDLRKGLLQRSLPIKEREEFGGLQESGIEYGATVALMRAKYTRPKATEENNWVKQRPEIEDILIDEQTSNSGAHMTGTNYLPSREAV